MHIRQTAFGSPNEVLSVVDGPVAAPGEHEVLVEVLAAPLLPMDHLRCRGHHPHLPTLPGRAGSVGVGRVVGGDAVPRGRMVVLPMRIGSWAQHVVCSTDGLIHLPDDTDPLQAALLRVDGLTAQALIAGLDRGSWLLLNAGSGGVSQYVIQLANRMGVKTAVVVRSMRDVPGATVVFVDGPELYKQVLDTIDGPLHRALDGVGGKATERLGSCLAEGGRVVHYGAMSQESPRLKVADAIFRGILLQGFWLHRVDQTRGIDAAGQILNRMLELKLPGKVDSTWALTDLQEALTRDASPERSGRVVWTPNATVN